MVTIADDMTIEEIMCLFYEEYGSDFNWHLVPFDNKTFVNELRRELNPDNEYIAGDVFAVAKCDSNDDVLFLSDKNVWRIYHLTYSSDNASKYPLYKEFTGRREAAEYLQEMYVNGV